MVPRLYTRNPTRLYTRETNSVVHEDAGALLMVMTVMMMMMTVMMMMMTIMMMMMMMMTIDDDDGGVVVVMMMMLVMMIATRCNCVFVMRIGGRVSALTPRFLYYSPHAVSAVMCLDFSCAVFSCQSFCTFDIYIYI